MNVLKRTSGALALVACLAAAVSGCGSDDEGAGITPDAAAALERQLASIQGRFEVGGGACTDITDGDDPNTTAVQQTIDSLPDDVDPDVRDALQQSFDRLFELVQQECEEPPAETNTTPEPEPEATETTETTPPETTETEPPPTETTEEPTTPTDTGEQTAPGTGDESGALPGGGNGGGALVPEGDDG
jgi:hypothetical protein